MAIAAQKGNVREFRPAHPYLAVALQKCLLADQGLPKPRAAEPHCQGGQLGGKTGTSAEGNATEFHPAHPWFSKSVFWRTRDYRSPAPPKLSAKEGNRGGPARASKRAHKRTLLQPRPFRRVLRELLGRRLPSGRNCDRGEAVMVDPETSLRRPEL